MLGEELGNISSSTDNTAENIWKDSTHKLVSKIEQQTPQYLQAYLKIHTESLHGFERWLGAWSAWQKQYLDVVGVNGDVVTAYGKLCDSWVNGIAESMDVFESYAKIQADVVSDAVKISNNVLQTWTDMYGKMIMFWLPRR